MADRAFRIHCARVYLAEAARRRHNPVSQSLYWRLLSWATDSRKRAAAMREPMQGGLFA